jgi:hypothetical protein
MTLSAERLQRLQDLIDGKQPVEPQAIPVEPEPEPVEEPAPTIIEPTAPELPEAAKAAKKKSCAPHGSATTTTQRERWSEVESILKSNFQTPDLEAFKVLLGSVAAHRVIDYKQAWLMLIAPPGSIKTVLLEALDGLPNFRTIDSLSPNTFISGKMRDPVLEKLDYLNRDSRKEKKKKKESSSLLHRIGPDGLIAIPDFSTILSMHESKRNDIFAQMRRIYDGELCREFGTDENLAEREWKGRITMLAAVTSEVDHHHRMFAALGDRFVRVRWARASGLEAMQYARRQRQELKNRLHDAVQDLLAPVFAVTKVEAPDLPDEIADRIGLLTESVCWARTHVHREQGEITDDPEAESNTRLPQQLCQVARGWTALIGETVVGEEGFDLACRTAIDCVPPNRVKMLKAIAADEALRDEFSTSSIDRVTADLRALGLLTITDTSKRLTPLAERLLYPPKSGRNNIISPFQSAKIE